VNQEISRLPNLTTGKWEELSIFASPGKRQPAIEVIIPFKNLREELQQQLPLANAYKDRPGTSAERLEKRLSECFAKDGF